MSDRATRDIIAVFNCLLLGRSETFVRAQAEALRDYRAVYVGSRHVENGLELPPDRTYPVNTGGMLGSAAEAMFKYTGRAPLLERCLATLRPALIHAHFGLGGALSMPIARRLNVPLITTFHGADATVHDTIARKLSVTHRIFIRRRPELFRQCALIITVSDFIRRKVIELGAPPEKVIIHHIGIDTDFFAPDDAVNREPVVLFVGRLVEKKGCDDLIRAMRDVRAAAPEARLRIVGDGQQRQHLEQLAQQNLPAGAYEFLGMQPPEVVREHVRRASIFCVPSVTAQSGDAEGFGLVFSEAQAMGTPVVSTRSGGITDAVDHGRTGLLVPERDPEALGCAIVQLLQDKQMWHAFSEAGIRFVRERFELMKQTAKLEQIYRSVVPHSAHTSSPTPAPASREGGDETEDAAVLN